MNKSICLRCGKEKVCRNRVHIIHKAFVVIPTVCNECDKKYVKEIKRGIKSVGIKVIQ